MPTFIPQVYLSFRGELPISNAQRPKRTRSARIWSERLGVGSSRALTRGLGAAAPRRGDLGLQPAALVVQLSGDLLAESLGVRHHVIETSEQLAKALGREDGSHPLGTITERHVAVKLSLSAKTCAIRSVRVPIMPVGVVAGRYPRRLTAVGPDTLPLHRVFDLAAYALTFTADTIDLFNQIANPLRPAWFPCTHIPVRRTAICLPITTAAEFHRSTPAVPRCSPSSAHR